MQFPSGRGNGLLPPRLFRNPNAVLAGAGATQAQGPVDQLLVQRFGGFAFLRVVGVAAVEDLSKNFRRRGFLPEVENAVFCALRAPLRDVRRNTREHAAPLVPVEEVFETK